MEPQTVVFKTVDAGRVAFPEIVEVVEKPYWFLLKGKHANYTYILSKVEYLGMV